MSKFTNQQEEKLLGKLKQEREKELSTIKQPDPKKQHTAESMLSDRRTAEYSDFMWQKRDSVGSTGILQKKIKPVIPLF